MKAFGTNLTNRAGLVMSVVRRRPEVVAKFKTAFLTRNGTSQSIFGWSGVECGAWRVLPYRHNGKIQVACAGESSFWSLLRMLF